jgi:hypothetical protein
MAKVCIALTANNFGSGHTVTMVRYFFDDAIGERLEIARPATARVELVIGVKQGRMAADAVVPPLVPMVPVGTRKGWFGVLKPCNGVLHVGKRFSIDIVGLLERGWRCGWIDAGFHNRIEGRRGEAFILSLAGAA